MKIRRYHKHLVASRDGFFIDKTEWWKKFMNYFIDLINGKPK